MGCKHDLRFIPALAIAILSIVSLSGHAADRVTFVFSEDMSGANARAADVFEREVAEKSRGALKVTLMRVPVGEMIRNLDKYLQTSATVVAAPSTAFAGHRIPELAVLDAPYLFTSKKSVYAALDGEPGDVLKKAIRERGYVPLAFFDGDFRVMVARRPLRNVQDLKGLKFHTSPTPPSRSMFESLGASATPLGFTEIYSALQRGVIDGAETNGLSFPGNSVVTVSNHTYISYPVLATQEAWNGISAKDRDIVHAVMRRAEGFQREQVQLATARSLHDAKLRNNAIYHLSDNERQSFKIATTKPYLEIERAAGKNVLNAFAEFESKYKATAGQTESIQFPVWYGTDRAYSDGGKSGIRYLEARGQSVRYGVCWVTIPKSHKFGSIGSDWLRRLFFGDDRLKVYGLQEISEKRFFSDIAGEISMGQAEGVLVYIHGFRNSFDSAMIRAAQIGADLQFPGPVVAFSWPSKNDVKHYAADEASIEASEDSLAKFLLDVAHATKSKKLHVIAHSMGNRGFLRAVNSALFQAASIKGTKFGQVILAAPDVDRDVFLRLAAAIPQLADKTTVYVSRRDTAIAASEIVHSAPRAGYLPPVTVMKGVDTIEAGSISVDLLGHGYLAEAEAMLNDIFSLIRLNGPAPDRRARLRQRETPQRERYWAFAD